MEKEPKVAVDVRTNALSWSLPKRWWYVLFCFVVYICNVFLREGQVLIAFKYVLEIAWNLHRNDDVMSDMKT